MWSADKRGFVPIEREREATRKRPLAASCQREAAELLERERHFDWQTRTVKSMVIFLRSVEQKFITLVLTKSARSGEIAAANMQHKRLCSARSADSVQCAVSVHSSGPQTGT